MNFKVTILGCGSALPAKGMHHAAQVINIHEQYYLVDCGEGTQSRMMQYGISPHKIRAVFISHLHGDHLYGIFPLISTLGLLGKKTPLKIFAPQPFGELLATVNSYLESRLPFEIHYQPIDPTTSTVIYENKVMEVTTVPLRHSKPAAGFLFREKTPQRNVYKESIEKYGLGMAQIVSAKNGNDITLGNGTVIRNPEITYRPYSPRSYAYISDTSYSGKVAKLVEGVDLLYHEATFSNEEKALAKSTGHSTAGDAAKAAVNSGAGQLIIGHFSARYKQPESLLTEARETFVNTVMAEEGETYTIPLKNDD